MTDSAFSPRRLARIGGVLYLLVILIGLLNEMVVRGRIVVSGDAMATAANLRAHEVLWRWGIAGSLIAVMCVTVLLIIWVVLLRPVQRDLVLLAAFFHLTATAAQVTADLQLANALFPLASADYLTVFSPEQLAALARMAVRGFGYGFGVSLFLWGGWFPVVGYLIFRSGFFPRFLGVLYSLAGVGYALSSFLLVVAPALSDRLFPVLGGLAFLGESSVCLWLLFKGVDEDAWKRRAAARVRPA